MAGWRWLTLPIAMLVVGAAPASDLRPELRALLSGELKFTTSDLADLEKGRVVTRGLGAHTAGEIAAVGAVRVNAHKETFVASYRDIVHFKRGESVLEIGRFSSPPTLDDLAPLSIDKKDVDVRTCRIGSCDIRLPSEAIRRMQDEIDWKARDAQTRVAELFKELLLDDVRAYVSGGAGRIVEYNDEKRPVRPVEDFLGLLKNSPYVDTVVPGLAEHLTAFPSNPLPGAEDFLYWSKEKFVLSPFVTVTHVTIAPPTSESAVIASKDVYSSRYFDASLTITIASDAVKTPGAFYLVYVNRSRANALKGMFADLRRSIVEHRVKGALDENLKVVKLRLEKGTE
jgi:hypothetical protein